jgi:hypothetical protein
MKKLKCANCSVVRTSAFPISDESGDSYCPDCNITKDICDECGEIHGEDQD